MTFGVSSIYFDARWQGHHGIARYCCELAKRIASLKLEGSPPLSLKGMIELEASVHRMKRSVEIYYSPGFNAPISQSLPIAFTIHDLIHLKFKAEAGTVKTAYYNLVVRPAARRARKVFTVSEYSRADIIEWAGLAEDRVVVATNGVDEMFTPKGPRFTPEYPYLLYIGNRKPHKNIARLLQAFAQASTAVDHDTKARLLLSGLPDAEIMQQAKQAGVLDRVVFAGQIAEADLPAYYRGAAAVVLPSLYEGFGLPTLEAMACGVPVACSTATSIPEVVGRAAILFNPYDVEDMAQAIKTVLCDEDVRAACTGAGLERARGFTWDHTAQLVQQHLLQGMA